MVKTTVPRQGDKSLSPLALDFFPLDKFGDFGYNAPFVQPTGFGLDRQPLIVAHLTIPDDATVDVNEKHCSYRTNIINIVRFDTVDRLFRQLSRDHEWLEALFKHAGKLDRYGSQHGLWQLYQLFCYLDPRQIPSDITQLLVKQWPWLYDYVDQRQLDHTAITDLLVQRPSVINKKPVEWQNRYITSDICRQIVNRHGSYIQHIPPRFISDKLRDLAVDNGNGYDYVPVTWQWGQLSVECLVKLYRHRLHAVKPHLTVILSSPKSTEFFKEIQNCILTELRQLNSQGRSDAYIDRTSVYPDSWHELLFNQEISDLLVQINAKYARYIPKPYLQDWMCELAVKRGWVWYSLDCSYVTTEAVNRYMKENYGQLRNIPKQFLTRDLALQYISQIHTGFELPDWWWDREFLETFIEQNGELKVLAEYPAVMETLTSDHVVKLVKRKWWNRNRIPTRLMSPELVLRIADKRGHAAPLGPPATFNKYFSDYQFCLEMISINPSYLQDIPAKHRTFELCTTAMRDPNNFVQLPARYRSYFIQNVVKDLELEGYYQIYGDRLIECLLGTKNINTLSMDLKSFLLHQDSRVNSTMWPGMARISSRQSERIRAFTYFYD